MILLIDTGPIVAYFDASEQRHVSTSRFVDGFIGQFVTSTAVATEVMWLLKSDRRVQNEFLMRLSMGVFRNESMTDADFARIAELNEQYSGLSADFADLSLIALAERLDIGTIFSFDKDFDVYRCRRGHRQVHLTRIVA